MEKNFWEFWNQRKNKILSFDFGFQTNRPNEVMQFASTIDGRNVCTACGAEYTFPSALYRHIRAKHLKLKYSCPICKKELARQDYFREHVAMHYEVMITNEQQQAAVTNSGGAGGGGSIQNVPIKPSIDYNKCMVTQSGIDSGNSGSSGTGNPDGESKNFTEMLQQIFASTASTAANRIPVSASEPESDKETNPWWYWLIDFNKFNFVFLLFLYRNIKAKGQSDWKSFQTSVSY